ncbi:MAG: hypothetical protein M5U34_36520 [Chloroflexi bacterium]|nr:hypothetical protein [Chloroflexota bacterium]
MSAEQREQIESRYWQIYRAVANYLYREDTQHPHEARAIALRELPNLRRALDLALAAAADDPALLETAVTFADRIALFLDVFGRWRERDGMMKQVSDRFTVNSGQSGRAANRQSKINNRQSQRLSICCSPGRGRRCYSRGRRRGRRRCFADCWRGWRQGGG